ncbi:MAG TPA: serine/threonine-protein kinase [Kofleriaceae bacterium]|nr:serine/threonine-protein kinase [Kofleriaceae bacterium]
MRPDADPPTEPNRDRDRDDADTLVPRPAAAAGSIAVEDVTGVSGTYAMGEIIGRGGMGEVLLAHDRRIGRDVALKRLRSASPTEDELARFLREARIQARLEHPAIVPVYEMGRDPTGRPFFAMKRVAGLTLGELLARGDTSRQRLVRAFAEVCRAIDYAHTRGVLHRDLKPSNIVLGEFGEVYVLDWGVARVVGDAADMVDTADVDTIEGATPPTHILGTPGYVSPEQLGDPDAERPADVYSLGSILFEILAGETLHPRGGDAVASTISEGTVLSPAMRRPDRNVPPELDRLCVLMLSRLASARPTARRCADLVEEYLDGDRDVARRRIMAHDLVSLARDALRDGRSGDAMRASSRALALDPEAGDAAEIVMHVMLAPPTGVAPEVRERLRESDGETVSQHSRAALPGYILIASFLPVLVWNGVRSWPTAIAMFVLALVMAVAAWDLTRRPHKSLGYMLAYAIGNSALIALMGRFAGPLLVVPAVFAFVTGSVVTYPHFLVRKWLLIGIMLAGFLLPIALEHLGVIAKTWEMNQAGLLTFGWGMVVDGTPAVVTIVVASLATIVMAGLQSARVSSASRAAHHRVVLHAHHLRQLLPQRPGP